MALMRISFDIDDTLILRENPQISSDRLLNGEVLRQGTLDLLAQLQKKHEIWIYTSSYRPSWLLKLSFAIKGIRIRRVINDDTHRKKCREMNLKSFPTKFPSLFDIDLHVDDSVGVEKEGEMYGFNVLRISQEDLNWTQLVLEEVKKF